jgi:beta-N-acetylhexosaminidase
MSRVRLHTSIFLLSTALVVTIMTGCAFLRPDRGTVTPVPTAPPATVTYPPAPNIIDLPPDSLLTDYSDSGYPHIESPWVDSTLASMTLREMLAQMIVPFAYSDIQPHKKAELKKLIRDYGIGGVIISKGSIRDAVSLITELQKHSKIPLLISSDFENGLSMRLSDATEFPSAMALGATRNPDLAYAMARAVADEMRALGVYQNYAPVADVNNNPLNPVINTRSFGEDPALVACLAEAYMRGLQDGRIIATAKHFPGHGDTETDSHNALPVLPYTRSRLDSIELLPFRHLVESGILSVMTGHLAVAVLDSESAIPATLSAAVTDSLLRRSLGFKGLIVTDAMNMKGLTTRRNSGHAAVRAVRAGVDVLLMPEDVPETIDSLARAAQRDEISKEQIKTSVRRILSYKQWLGLCENRLPDTAAVRAGLLTGQHQVLAQRIAREAVTLARNDSALLPLRKDTSQSIVHLSFVSNHGLESSQFFTRLLLQRDSLLSSVYLDAKIKPKEREEIIAAASAADVVLVSCFIPLRAGNDRSALSQDQRAVLDQLQSCGKPIALASFGNPYFLSQLPQSKAYLCTYGEDSPSIEQAARVLFGEEEPRGALPVTVPGLAAFGASLRYAPPPDAENDTLKTGIQKIETPPPGFKSVEDLIERQIRKRSFPGAQLLVQQHGRCMYSKSFGTLTYDSAAVPVSDTSMYDLASVSKVVATTTAVMRLFDEGRLHLDDTVAKILPAFGKNGKSRITIRNLLVHNSGLVAFRSYYTFITSAQQLLDTIFAEPLTYPTGTKTVYSDLGMITLAKVIEAITGMSLDAYVKQILFDPLGMKRTMYTPPDSLRPAIAPTENDSYWRHRLVWGTVHDENAALLNGVAGHAGLFSTARDLARFAQLLLNGGEMDSVRILQKSTIDLFTHKQRGSESRALGWDTKSSRSSSAGRYFSARSFGHTGFTGTSIWIDPDADMFVIFLTNRVHPTRENRQLIPFRAVLHDAVREALSEIEIAGH